MASNVNGVMVCLISGYVVVEGNPDDGSTLLDWSGTKLDYSDHAR
jgi:hypothetical protein